MVTIRKKPKHETTGDRWHGRPVLSALLSGAIIVVPITLSIVAATITAHLLPRPHTTVSLAGWWIAVLVVPSVVLFVTDRLARRALPLAVLLKMTMVFPDRAPKRLAVAPQGGKHPESRSTRRGGQDARDRRRARGRRREDPLAWPVRSTPTIVSRGATANGCAS